MMEPAERHESASDGMPASDALDLQDVGAGLKPAPTDNVHALDRLACGVFAGRHRGLGRLTGQSFLTKRGVFA